MPTLVVNENSYVDVAYADDYFDNRLFSENWYSQDADTKMQALIMATKKIDNLVLSGIKAVEDQKLQMPRAFYTYRNTYYYPQHLLGYRDNNWIVETEVSQNVKDAVCEEALAILEVGNSNRTKLQNQGVKSYSAGEISETYDGRKRSLLSPTAKELLKKYIAGSVVVI